MPPTFKITHPRARLEAHLVVAPSFSPGFTLIHYEQGRTNARWWERTLRATDQQWLSLSGRDRTSPQDTWSKILDHQGRPALPLPMLVLGDFVAYASEQRLSEARWLLQWVTWALDDLLRFNPLPPTMSGGTIVATETREAAAHAVMNAVFAGTHSIPWPMTDGAQLQTILQLGALLWSFPPNLVRQLVSTFVTCYEQDHERVPNVEDAPDLDSRDIHRPVIGPDQVVQLSGMYLWRTQLPRVRQLSVHMSTIAFPALIQQALVLTHPDAPLVDDADLARLCDGMIGRASDPPSPIQPAYNDAVNLPNFAPAAVRSRIATYAQEASTGSSTVPIGQWELGATSHFPLFRALDLHAVYVLVTPGGCWVRLLPRRDQWGKALWWMPQIEPHPCLAFTFGVGREHPLVWALHETMWMLWRDIHVDGDPRLD